MNSVFNMPVWALIVTLTFLLGPSQVLADNCSIIDFSTKGGNIIQLVMVDSKPLAKSVRFINSREHFDKFYVSPGQHVLNVDILDIKAHRLWGKTKAYTKKSRKLIQALSMNMEANKKYTVDYIESNTRKEKELSIIKVEDTPCIFSVENANNIKSKELSIAIDNKALPSYLEKALRKTLNQLSVKNATENDITANLVPMSEDPYFGVIVDESFTSIDTLRILTVLPMTLAAQIGLRAGDEIIGLGEKKVIEMTKEPREAIAQYLQNTLYSKELIFEIIRQGEVIELKSAENTILIPQSIYYVGEVGLTLPVAKVKPIENSMQFSYERLILALYTYYKSSGVVADRIHIQRAKSINVGLGLKGLAAYDGELQINSVEKEGPMWVLGIRAGDKIIAFNEANLNGNLESFTRPLNKLIQGERYTVTINRNTKDIVLHGVKLVSYDTAFTIVLDMNSLQLGLKLLAQHGVEKTHRNSHQFHSYYDFRDSHYRNKRSHGTDNQRPRKNNPKLRNKSHGKDSLKGGG